MKSAFLTTFIFISSIACFAQKQNTYYLKNDGRYVPTRDSADFVRIVQEPETGSDLYNVFDLYKDGSRKLIGKSSKVMPVVFEGQVASFYPNGKKMQVANYHKNHLTGPFYQYYPNGKIFSVVQFRERTDGAKGDYWITSCLDTAGRELVKEGNGHYNGYDGGGDGIIEEGDVKNGMREGDWKGSLANIGVTFAEHYEQGKLISGVSTDKAGNKHNYTERYTRPYYRAGSKALGKFLENQISYFGKDESVNAKGTAVISFYIDAKSNITDIKISNSENASMNIFLTRSVAASYRGWAPAALFGIPRKEYYSFPYSLDPIDIAIYY